MYVFCAEVAGTKSSSVAILNIASRRSRCCPVPRFNVPRCRSDDDGGPNFGNLPVSLRARTNDGPEGTLLPGKPSSYRARDCVAWLRAGRDTRKLMQVKQAAPHFHRLIA